jgi:hypothetical protein
MSHMHQLGGGVDDFVPSLCDSGAMPGAKWMVEFHGVGRTKALMQ